MKNILLIGDSIRMGYDKAVQKSLGLKKYSYGETQMDEKAYIEFLQQNHEIW